MKTGSNAIPRSQQGFSLVELIVAMTITLIITSAVYGLLTAGNSAFRREPEAADRQQNIRVGLSLVQQDLYQAGSGLDLGSQRAFSDLDGAGTLTGVAANVDGLQFVSADDNCPTVAATSSAPDITATLPTCFPAPSDPFPVAVAIVCFGAGGCATPRWGLFGVTPTGLTLLAAQPADSQLTPAALVDVTAVRAARLIRYEIADQQAGGPRALYRSERGGYDAAGAYQAPPAGAEAGGWREVAVGIEDLQLQYQWPAAGAAFASAPPAPADWSTIVTRVQVVLTARALAPGAPLQGATTFGAGGLGGPALRGQLVTGVTIRPALAALGQPGALHFK